MENNDFTWMLRAFLQGINLKKNKMAEDTTVDKIFHEISNYRDTDIEEIPENTLDTDSKLNNDKTSHEASQNKTTKDIQEELSKIFEAKNDKNLLGLDKDLKEEMELFSKEPPEENLLGINKNKKADLFTRRQLMNKLQGMNKTRALFAKGRTNKDIKTNNAKQDLGFSRKSTQLVSIIEFLDRLFK